MIAVADVMGPAEVSQSGEATFDAYVSFKDEAYPQDAIDKVAYLLYDAEGSLVSSGEAVVRGGRTIRCNVDPGTVVETFRRLGKDRVCGLLQTGGGPNFCERRVCCISIILCKVKCDRGGNSASITLPAYVMLKAWQNIFFSEESMGTVLQNDIQQSPAPMKKKPASAFVRVVKFSAVRLASLLFSVVVAIFLTIIIANMGGKVDELRMGEIRETVVQTVRSNPANRGPPSGTIPGVDRGPRLSRGARAGIGPPLHPAHCFIYEERHHSRFGKRDAHDQRHRLEAGAPHHP